LIGNCGTLWYQAPEILEGKLYTPSADVWSVGSLFYEMIHGKTPFAADTKSLVIDKIKAGMFEIKSELP